MQAHCKKMTRAACSTTMDLHGKETSYKKLLNIEKEKKKYDCINSQLQLKLILPYYRI